MSKIFLWLLAGYALQALLGATVGMAHVVFIEDLFAPTLELLSNLEILR